MLEKIDLKLFKILDKEINKKLTEWCLLKDNFGRLYKICVDDRIYQYNWDWFEIDDEDKKYNPLWHYPNHAEVLRYCIILGCITENINSETISFLYYKWEKDWVQITAELDLDITKDIKDYTEEKKKELADFLEEIK